MTKMLFVLKQPMSGIQIYLQCVPDYNSDSFVSENQNQI